MGWAVQKIGLRQVQLLQGAAFAAGVGLVLDLELLVVFFVGCAIFELDLWGLRQRLAVDFVWGLEQFILFVVLLVAWVSFEGDVRLPVLGVWAFGNFGWRGGSIVLFVGSMVVEFGWRLEAVVGYLVSGVQVGVFGVHGVLKFKGTVVLGVWGGGVKGHVRPDYGFLNGGWDTPMF